VGFSSTLFFRNTFGFCEAEVGGLITGKLTLC
jgi:hypothetical protein